MESITPSQIIIGCRYQLTGNIVNGRKADGSVNTTHENVVRKVTNVTQDYVVCECGRRFIIDSELNISNNQIRQS